MTLENRISELITTFKNAQDTFFLSIDGKIATIKAFALEQFDAALARIDGQRAELTAEINRLRDSLRFTRLRLKINGGSFVLQKLQERLPGGPIEVREDQSVPYQRGFGPNEFMTLLINEYNIIIAFDHLMGRGVTGFQGIEVKFTNIDSLKELTFTLEGNLPVPFPFASFRISKKTFPLALMIRVRNDAEGKVTFTEEIDVLVPADMEAIFNKEGNTFLVRLKINRNFMHHFRNSPLNMNYSYYFGGLRAETVIPREDLGGIS